MEAQMSGTKSPAASGGEKGIRSFLNNPSTANTSCLNKDQSVLHEIQHQPSAGGDTAAADRIITVESSMHGIEKVSPSAILEGSSGSAAIQSDAENNLDLSVDSSTVPSHSNSTSGSSKATKRSKGISASGTPGQAKRKRGPAKPKRSAVQKLTDMTRPSAKAVHAALKECGVLNPEAVNPCLKRAIQIRYISLNKENPLDQEAYRGDCFQCGESRAATVRDLLYQRTYAGLDYEDGGLDASVKCEGCEGLGLYVTNLCYGTPEFDSGKFHNHCTVCPGFGKCIGDYREAHCMNCGRHYFAGLQGLPCQCEDRRSGRRDECSIQ